jgi:CheY-like chemotaxis protein
MTSPTPSPNSERRRVVIIETASVFREVQMLLLHHAGYDVVIFEQTAAALDHARCQNVDVTIINSDGSIEESGTLIQALRALQPKMAVIAIAPALTLEITRDLTRYGAAAVFHRPASPHRLVAKIDELTGQTAPGAPLAHAMPDASNAPFPGGSNTGLPNSATPFNVNSAPPFPTQSASPFSPHSASPFSSNSASPFRPESNSPFSTRTFVSSISTVAVMRATR